MTVNSSSASCVINPKRRQFVPKTDSPTRLEKPVDSASETACAAHKKPSHRPSRRCINVRGENQGSAAATPSSSSTILGVTS